MVPVQSHLFKCSGQTHLSECAIYKRTLNAALEAFVLVTTWIQRSDVSTRTEEEEEGRENDTLDFLQSKINMIVFTHKNLKSLKCEYFPTKNQSLDFF